MGWGGGCHSRLDSASPRQKTWHALPVEFLDFIHVFRGGDGAQIAGIHDVNAHSYVQETFSREYKCKNRLINLAIVTNILL